MAYVTIQFVKKRLDLLLLEKKLFESRAKAQAVIMAGLVYVDGVKVDKAGSQINADAEITVKGQLHPYVSRGGLKLEAALKKFKINVAGKIALDVGASTGGFTDCLLQHGAIKVYAVDVGYGQIAWKLRQDNRVRVIERTNARNLTLNDLGLKVSDINFSVIDVSFISLSKILPAVYNLLVDKGEVVALIKPQFEAKREQVGKGGIIKDERVRDEVVEKIKVEAKAIGFEAKGIIKSPITGADGNIEFLLYLVKK
ncbi:MAG: TlyA family RNA methyltransferase [Candidatus Margulisbacteria bacterium]|nr:TlyA family RNA methyltransferase [Candidatus Margulisiibacteriota bacterium]